MLGTIFLRVHPGAVPRGLLKSDTFQLGFHGVMVSTLDSESSDPSSNLGGTCHFVKSLSLLGTCCLP